MAVLLLMLKVDLRIYFYICPEYWDMSKKTSLTHEYVQENHKDDIVDPKSKGLTEKFILERSKYIGVLLKVKN